MQNRSAAVRGCAQRAEQKLESCMTRTALHVMLRSRNLSAYYSYGREDDLWPPDTNAHLLRVSGSKAPLLTVCLNSRNEVAIYLHLNDETNDEC